MQWANSGADKMAKRYDRIDDDKKTMRTVFCRKCLKNVEPKMVRTVRFFGKKLGRCPICNEAV